MAAGLMRLRYGPLARVDSAGVRPGEAVDYLAAAVMDERGADLTKHRPRGLDDLDEDIRYNVVISLSPEAHHTVLNRAAQLAQPGDYAAEYWPTFDASAAEGSREQRLQEYRMVRDGLDKRIAERFPRPSTG
jgi:protein-tyrosine-phosphatase